MMDKPQLLGFCLILVIGMLICACFDYLKSDRSMSNSSAQTELNRSAQVMATARGVDASALTNSSEHYGYTSEDQAFLQSAGISEREARAAELTVCASGGGC